MTKDESVLKSLMSLKAEEVETEIAAIDEQIAALEKKRAALKLAKRFVDVRDHGKPERKPRKDKKITAIPHTNGAPVNRLAGGLSGKSIRERIKEYLDTHGAQKPATIAKGINAEYQSVYSVLNGSLDFRSTPDGFALA